jgi:hypothetical protein
MFGVYMKFLDVNSKLLYTNINNFSFHMTPPTMYTRYS